MSWQGLRGQAWERVEDLYHRGRPCWAGRAWQELWAWETGQRSTMGWFYSPLNSSGKAHGMRPFLGQLKADQEKELVAL